MNESHLSPSELIINPDGSIYHLNIKPGDIAQTIITVGDPARVQDITKHFESIEVDVHHREFRTQTGYYKSKRITVISTGIGTDNIDIVFNELDALVNIDFETRSIKPVHTELNFIRVGTSGAIQLDIPINSLIVSEIAVGFDGLIHFYKDTHFLDEAFSNALIKHTHWNSNKSAPYVVAADKSLLDLFRMDTDFKSGVTVTNVGFYAPQGRKLRLNLEDEELNEKLRTFQMNGKRITNLEMETSGIYGMASLLGHKAISLNAILANRTNGEFSSDPTKTVEKLIKKTLDLLAI